MRLSILALVCSFSIACVAESAEPSTADADSQEGGAEAGLVSHPVTEQSASYCEAHPDIPACSDAGSATETAETK